MPGPFPFGRRYEPVGSEGLVAAVAHGRDLALLAGAEPLLSGDVGGIGHGGEAGALVGTVAHGLVLAVAAGAPVVGLAGFHLDLDGTLLGDGGFGIGHGNLLGGKG